MKSLDTTIQNSSDKYYLSEYSKETMAEGGIFPWKSNRDNTKYADYSDLQKPLANPPIGYSWVRTEEGGPWELQNEGTGEKMPYVPEELPPLSQRQKPVEAVKVEHLPDYIEHVVMPEDTLQGLCLRYKIKANLLRKCNGFIGDHFRTEKVLRIPTEQLRNTPGAVFLPQSRTGDVLIQLFKGETGLDTIEARLYLEDHEFDFDKALAAWKEDETWEKEELIKQVAISEKTKEANKATVVVAESVKSATVSTSREPVVAVLVEAEEPSIEMSAVAAKVY
jgi:hypothetical protein